MIPVLEIMGCVIGGVVVVALLFLAETYFVNLSPRRSRRAESLTTAFRIHEIASAARAAMWDEVQRHRSGGA